MADKRLPLFMSAAMIAISICLLLYSVYIPIPITQQVSDAKYGYMFFPRIVLVLWLICAIILFFQYYLYSFSMKPINCRRLAYSVGTVLLLCIMLAEVGFIPSCILFCIAYPYLLGYKNIPVLAAVGTCYALAIWYTFENILLIILPATTLF